MFAEDLRHTVGVDIPVTAELARAIQAEITEQNLTYAEIDERGGPSSPTLRKILSGEGTIGPATARKLETALGLARGSISLLARGQQKRARKAGPLLREATQAEIAAELARRAATG